MNIEQINELRDTFRAAMLNWDVPVSAKVSGDEIDISFELWRVKFEGSFSLEKGQWNNGYDCPHYITDHESVWQWIAMHLYDKLTA
jgi:hypothetical protein